VFGDHMRQYQCPNQKAEWFRVLQKNIRTFQIVLTSVDSNKQENTSSML